MAPLAAPYCYTEAGSRHARERRASRPDGLNQIAGVFHFGSERDFLGGDLFVRLTYSADVVLLGSAKLNSRARFTCVRRSDFFPPFNAY